ncbi:ATP-binding cassette domain-containing protein [Myxococcus sp. K15C18031901]|uniref:ATP-binding cassette domain-containing protein n=1 Tax=Myxococcus dinghuensis TaxID=2906761 RepID=UPI0020A82BC7|nr:ATP-binding cassette domain-containing protein [Myxococcus dinghuensis]MCP3097982.1 ATP-binding cassette domain-containing protein [Myxococcus dinghuensis]
MAATPLLELKGITRHFGAIQALRQVDFEVHAGEVVALVGDNGAGKSTLVKTLAGILPVEEGQVFFEGQPVRLTGPQSATALGVATVYQDLALCDNLDVVGNLFLGRELTARGPGGLDETTMEVQATQLLRRLSVSLPSVRTQVAALSGGQRQSIAVARAMMGSPRVVLLDEPTAALGVAQTRQVLDLIRRLREQGLGVVVISHNLVDVFSVANRIVVMRLGRRVATFDTKAAREVDVVAAITGVDTTESNPRLTAEAP